MNNFERMMPLLFAEEGGQVNDPHDPGGETNMGVTWQALKQAQEQGIIPASVMVTSLTKDQAVSIYRALYWDAVHGDDLPWPLCCFVFDAAVNQGVAPAIKMLQRTLNVSQDGVLGTVTISAASKSGAWHAARFMAFRAMRYHGTRNFDRFGEGWLIRIFGLAMKTSGDENGK